MGDATLATAAVLIGIVLASPLAAQVETTGKPEATSKPHEPGEAALKQARRWVTFLELDNRRAEAADALLKMGPKGVPALVQALDDPRPVVAQRAAHILRVLGSQAVAAKERLTVLSNSDDSQLAYPARYALFRVDQPAGITLVASDRLRELDETGKVVRTLPGVKSPRDAERLPNGNYLVCDTGAKRVVEVTAKGEVVWSLTEFEEAALKAQRLPDGNTLIVDFRSRVLEVDRASKIVWEYDEHGVSPLDAERLVNGNTLIVDHGKTRVIEITPEKRIVWEYGYGPKEIVLDADRLPSGNTLITVYGNLSGMKGKVIEVTPKGEVVWELKGLRGLFGLMDAERLPNGHTLVAQNLEVGEYDATGKKVWSARARMSVKVTRY